MPLSTNNKVYFCFQSLMTSKKFKIDDRGQSMPVCLSVCLSVCVTTCRCKAKDVTPLITCRRSGVKNPQRSTIYRQGTRKGHWSIRPTLEPFQKSHWETCEMGWSAQYYGLCPQVLKCHLELN